MIPGNRPSPLLQQANAPDLVEMHVCFQCSRRVRTGAAGCDPSLTAVREPELVGAGRIKLNSQNGPLGCRAEAERWWRRRLRRQHLPGLPTKGSLYAGTSCASEKETSPSHSQHLRGEAGPGAARRAGASQAGLTPSSPDPGKDRRFAACDSLPILARLPHTCCGSR